MAQVINPRPRPHQPPPTAATLQAQERHPARWSGATRDWSSIDAVTLNPERDAMVKSAAASAQHIQLKAA